MWCVTNTLTAVKAVLEAVLAVWNRNGRSVSLRTDRQRLEMKSLVSSLHQG